MPMSSAVLFQWVLLPRLIFIARLIDVSLDTMRILFISRGRRLVAAILGFVQVLIWLMAIRQIFLNLSNPVCFIAYAAGFASGTWTGALIEEKLALGIQVVRVIVNKDASELIKSLKERGWGVTTVDGHGALGAVSVIYTIVQRHYVRKVIEVVMETHPKAFYTVEDIRSSSDRLSIGSRNLLRRGIQARR